MADSELSMTMQDGDLILHYNKLDLVHRVNHLRGKLHYLPSSWEAYAARCGKELFQRADSSPKAQRLT